MKNVVASLAVFLSVTGLIAACGYSTQNSVSSDAERYSPTTQTGRFAKATAVMRKHCISCHVFGSLAEQAYTTTLTVDAGDPLVTPGNLNASALWRKLRGGGSGGDMPPSTSVTADEVAVMRDWIVNFGQPERRRPPGGHGRP